MSYLLSLLNEAAIVGSVAAVQGLLVRRLGLAIAAIPAFLGLGAYLVVAVDIGILQVAMVVACALVLGILMAWLANRLPRDLYLLATLALLECLSALFGNTESLGAREGLQLKDSFILGNFSGDSEIRAFPWCVGCLMVTVVWIRILLSTPIGIAIDRIRERPETADRWFPAERIRAVVLILAILLSIAVGIVYAGYQEHVSPSVFTLNTALWILAFSVMGGRIPELAAVAAVLYSLLPYVLEKLTGLSGSNSAQVVQILFGSALVIAVVLPAVLKARRHSLLIKTCSLPAT